MIHTTPAILSFLLLLEISILFVSSRPRFEKYFSFIPPVFWIYFLPMIAASFGWIDSKHSVYQSISTYLLPASLILLLLSSDIRSILKLERPAIIMMLAGALGIMIATPLVFSLVKGMVGANMWGGFGALSASWIGGSANMIAVKEATGTPDAVFTPMVIVDTVVPYTWMAILIALVTLQPLYDKWNRSDRSVLNDLALNITNLSAKEAIAFNFFKVIMILGIAAGGAAMAYYCSQMLPVVKNIISPYTWSIILASLFGILLSFTPAQKLERSGASKIGYFILYFVLTSIGAKANVTHIGTTAVLICAGFLIVLIHMAVILITGRLIKAPMFLAVVASQANIGGVASAPIVAAVYQPGLASVGLLLAVLGNIVGTYLGIVTGHLCFLVSR